MAKEHELISLILAAEIVGVDPSTLRRAAIRKRLDARKFGRDWLTTKQAVIAWKNAEEFHKTAPKKHRKNA